MDEFMGRPGGKALVQNTYKQVGQVFARCSSLESLVEQGDSLLGVSEQKLKEAQSKVLELELLVAQGKAHHRALALAKFARNLKEFEHD